MRQLLLICVVLTGCQPADKAFLAIEPLPAPTTVEIGIPVRVVAVGGHGVALELTQGKFGDDGTTSRCLTLDNDASAPDTTEVGSEIVVVVPDDVESLVIGRLHERCPENDDVNNPMMEDAANPALAVTQRTLRVAEPNMPTGSGTPRTAGGGS